MPLGQMRIYSCFQFSLDENLAQLEEGANQLASHLRYRQPPIEDDEYRSKAAAVEEDIKAKGGIYIEINNFKGAGDY